MHDANCAGSTIAFYARLVDRWGFCFINHANFIGIQYIVCMYFVIPIIPCWKWQDVNCSLVKVNYRIFSSRLGGGDHAHKLNKYFVQSDIEMVMYYLKFKC